MRRTISLGATRDRLSFRAVNRRTTPDYDPGLQRHHLLPRQLLGQRCFGPLFQSIGRDRVGFDDFRSNGLLLPCRDEAALRIGLPLHRGPHRDYNAMVIERVGQVEADWSALRTKAPEIALDQALMRLGLLQRALRRRLLDPLRRPIALNRHDPLGHAADFAEIDAMAEALWGETGEPAELPDMQARVFPTYVESASARSPTRPPILYNDLGGRVGERAGAVLIRKTLAEPSLPRAAAL